VNETVHGISTQFNILMLEEYIVQKIIEKTFWRKNQHHVEEFCSTGRKSIGSNATSVCKVNSVHCSFKYQLPWRPWVFHQLLFKAIVLSKITYCLPVYGASEADLNVIRSFLKRCFKRRYISKPLNIRQLLEESDRKLIKNFSIDSCHPLYPTLPRVKESSTRLGCNSGQLPEMNTERFKSSFINRLSFKYQLLI
jgi:hypothetical protein